jgi:hypothetical protein
MISKKRSVRRIAEREIAMLAAAHRKMVYRGGCGTHR